jgi:hypothetical protein
VSVAEEKFGWRITSVKLVHADVVGVLASEVLTSVREAYFSTVFYGNGFIRYQTLVKDVHHFYLFSEPNDNLETTWMQSE